MDRYCKFHPGKFHSCLTPNESSGKRREWKNAKYLSRKNLVKLELCGDIIRVLDHVSLRTLRKRSDPLNNSPSSNDSDSPDMQKRSRDHSGSNILKRKSRV